MRFLKSNIFCSKYKLLISVIWLYFLGFLNLSAKDIFVDASDLFSYPATMNYNYIKNMKPKILKADDNVKPVMISETVAENIFNSVNSKIVINNFPVSPYETATVELVKSTSAVRLGTNWTIMTKDGAKQIPGFEPAFYTGKINGDDNSKVNILYFKGNLYSVVEREDYDNFSISPVLGITNKNAHILTSQQSSLLGQDFNPFLDVHLDDEPTNYDLIKKYSEKTLSNELLQADIIIEATNDFYLLFNDLNKVTAYIAAVMTHTSQIFESNVYIQLFVSQVIIHQNKDTDPYKNTTQILQRLTQVRNQWINKTVKRAIVCLMTDIDYQGGSGGYRIGGVSNGLGTLCNNNWGYCVFGMQGHYKYPTTNYTWDVSVSAHELGHAFGSPHTHSCDFAPNMIDTCVTRYSPQESDGCVTTGNPIPRPGTLMSYCHLTNGTNKVGMYFHDRVKPVIRGFAEHASCLKSAVDPTLILLNPGSGSVLFPGDKVEIKWASSKVEFVAIKYTLNDGASWNWIEKYADALNGSFLWDVPDTITYNLKIWIQDSYNAYVNDETTLPLSIVQPIFSVQTPVESERVGNNNKYKIKWENKYLDNFQIELNSEADKIGAGTENWTTIASGVTGASYDWNVPNIQSENCIIRIIGTLESGTEFVELSGKFAIGNPILKILSPIPFDKLCAGQVYEIKWESDFIQGMYLQYTIDDGDKWKQVKFSPVNASDGIYLWKVPAIVTDNCKLRFSNFENRDVIYAVNNQPFSIDSCQTDVNELDKKFENSLLNIIDVIPNPATNNITLTFDLLNDSISDLELMITNETGTIIEKMDLHSITIGLNKISINLNKFAQGNYYLILQSVNFKTSAALKILR